MQLDMLQEDLFSDLQDTQDVTPSKPTPKENLSAHLPTGKSKPIDLITAHITPVLKREEQQSGKNAPKPDMPKSQAEHEIPSTATLLDEEPEGSEPIGSVLPVLGTQAAAAQVYAQRLPTLESPEGLIPESLTAEMPDDLYSRDAMERESEVEEYFGEDEVAQEDVQEVAQESNGKAPGAFKTISEVAGFLGVPQHVLRFWESRFSQIKPIKSRGGRRYYRQEDIEVLSTIKHLLYKQGYTIKGAKKVFSSRNREALDAAHLEVAVPVIQKAEKRVIVEKAFVVEKPALDEKKRKQLSAIRNELLGLRDTLSTYLQ
jgi:DNA-binding transcriptional MerR regulator